jgi:signal transduction histidine kinase
MKVQNWLMSTLSSLFSDQNSGNKTISQAYLHASRQWFGAIASMEQLILPLVGQNACQGVILTAPAPVLTNQKLASLFEMGNFTSEVYPALLNFQLPAAKNSDVTDSNSAIISLPLFPNDPLIEEQFCLVLTKKFGLLLLLGYNSDGFPTFNFSFDPEILLETWTILRARLLLTNHHQLERFDHLIEKFTPPIPDYRLVAEFGHKMLNNLPDLSLNNKPETININLKKSETEEFSLRESPEFELLQALTHEVRTPLTTIKTLTKLLLKKRANLSADIVKRIELIEQECTEQINRMELIFKATEFNNKSKKLVELVPISLEQLFQQSIPKWQKQAERRNIILDFILPPNLPQVITDPAMLEQVLTGVIENFTRSLSIGGKIQVLISTAGNQLKLQMLSEGNYNCNNPFKSLGQLLMFQPETGSLTLNLDVTKNMFQALGGKLIIKQKPNHNQEVFTIFLPLNKTNKPENKYCPFTKKNSFSV